MIKTLIVEDDPVWQNRLTSAFVSGNFKIITATKLELAEIALRKNHFDLICLDLELPDSCAYNTLKNIASVANYIPVVIVTTMEDKKLEEFSFELGIEDFLLKNTFSEESFVYSSLKAIKRMNKKISNNFNKNLENIFNNLKSLEKKLCKLNEQFVSMNDVS